MAQASPLLRPPERESFTRRYADGMGGIHVGDCFPGFLSPERRRDVSYHDVSATKRLWAGREVMDFAAVVAAVPADYYGDLMIEVDERSMGSKMESHCISFEWALRALAGVGS